MDDELGMICGTLVLIAVLMLGVCFYDSYLDRQVKIKAIEAIQKGATLKVDLKHLL